ncbi:hypothetical protein SAMN05660337_2623 [Maridesulfovibrio ferrireducens]|uniref:von Willebrand factor type A domain-containing protein n=1 Tax=Maridesulfovibrio ferrireducens TaxID=246191 RepID=A0A1G9J3G6_9BACT|nr:VWA domain-containing protein [Maridesulfovibrio ferrireducens]SDL31862.1 hypothetical protein SAMN05660337_2623 [Maridesulfovibrio ferrireducens]
MISNKYYACLLLVLIYAGFACPAQARVVSVVYDDSMSMFGGFNHKFGYQKPTDQWIYANYALQTLAALMHKEDTLNVVRMSAVNATGPTKIPSYSGDKVSSAISDIRNYGCGGKTPYKPVSVAVEHFLASTLNDSLLKKVKENRKDWLIIITDGVFNNQSKNVALDIEKFKEKAGNDCRVIFLLIGSDASEALYQKWRKEVGGHVDDLIKVSTAGGGKHILDAMKKVAARIEGRDEFEDRFPSNFSGDKFEFRSIFPLLRVSVLQQVYGSNDFSKPQKLIAPDGREILFKNVEIKSPHKEKITSSSGVVLKKVLQRDISGIISIAGNGERVMGPGTYQIDCPGRFTSSTLKKLLIETAMNFQPELQVEGRGVVKEREGSYVLCRDDRFRIYVKFSDYKTGDHIKLSAEQAAQIDVHVLDSEMTAIGKRFHFDKNLNLFISEWQNVSSIKGASDRKEISIRAVSQGYFHLKSGVFKINAKEGSREVVATLNSPLVNVPYKYCDVPEEVGSVAVDISKGADKGMVQLSARDLPEGITISSRKRAGVTGCSSEVLYFPGNPVAVYLYRDKQFTLSSPTDVSVDIQFLDDPAIRLKNKNLKFQIVPQKRNLEFVQSMPFWNGSVAVPEEVAPLILQIREDGQSIDLKHENWEVEPSINDELEFAVMQDSEVPGGYEIAPVFGMLTPPLPASAGEFPVQLNWKGPFPGEILSSNIILSMNDADWWAKYKSVIGWFLLICFLSWYVWRLLTKQRFAKDARIKSEVNRSGVPPKFHTEFLSRQGVGSLLVKWFWPSVAEVKNIRGVIFKAGMSPASIVVDKSCQNKDMFLAGMPLDFPKRKDQSLSRWSSLEVRGNSSIKKYHYE